MSKKNKQSKYTNLGARYTPPPNNTPNTSPPAAQTQAAQATNLQNNANAATDASAIDRQYEQMLAQVEAENRISIEGDFVLDRDNMGRTEGWNYRQAIGAWIAFGDKVVSGGSTRRTGSSWYYRLKGVYSHSSTNQALVNKTIDLVVGSGFVVKKHEDPLKPTEIDKAKDNLNQTYLSRANAVLRPIIWDYLNFCESFVAMGANGVLDYWSLEHTRLQVGENIAPKYAGYDLDWSGTRKSNPSLMAPIYPNKGLIERSADNLSKTQQQNRLKTGGTLPIPKKLKEGEFETVFRITNRNSSELLWKDFKYMALVLPAMTEYYAARDTNTGMESGNIPTAMATFPGEDPTSIEFKLWALQLHQLGKGVGSSHGVTAVAIPDGGGLFFPPRPDKEEHREKLERAEADIIKNRGYSKSIAGVSTTGALGSNREQETEYDRVIRETIEPLQKELFEQFLKPYFQYCDANFGTTIMQMWVKIDTQNPISIKDTVDFKQIATINEQRAVHNLPPIDSPYANIPAMLIELILAAEKTGFDIEKLLQTNKPPAT